MRGTEVILGLWTQQASPLADIFLAFIRSFAAGPSSDRSDLSHYRKLSASTIPDLRGFFFDLTLPTISHYVFQRKQLQ